MLPGEPRAALHSPQIVRHSWDLCQRPRRSYPEKESGSTSDACRRGWSRDMPRCGLGARGPRAFGSPASRVARRAAAGDRLESPCLYERSPTEAVPHRQGPVVHDLGQQPSLRVRRRETRTSRGCRNEELPAGTDGTRSESWHSISRSCGEAARREDGKTACRPEGVSGRHVPDDLARTRGADRGHGAHCDGTGTGRRHAAPDSPRFRGPRAPDLRRRNGDVDPADSRHFACTAVAEAEEQLRTAARPRTARQRSEHARGRVRQGNRDEEH